MCTFVCGFVYVVTYECVYKSHFICASLSVCLSTIGVNGTPVKIFPNFSNEVHISVVFWCKQGVLVPEGTHMCHYFEYTESS